METVNVNILSESSIEDAIKQIQKYRDSLYEKTQRFVELLLDIGIRVAEEKVSAGTHNMPQRITFYKDYEIPNEDEVTGIIVGVGETFLSHWKDADGNIHDDEVFPLAMMEFGSAGYALPPQNAFQGYGGQGTFSVSGHSEDVDWYFDTDTVDENGKPIRKHGTAIKPTRPLYNAMLEMTNQIESCAKKAFGGT